MFCYFLCATPCAVKLNGNFIGKASHNFSFIDANEGFFEFVPLDQSFSNVNFLLENKPIPSNTVRIIDLYGGLLIIPTFLRKPFGEFKMIGRKSFSFSNGVTATCYNQGGVKLCITSGNDVFIESLPFTPEDVRFESCAYHGKEYMLVICVGSKALLLAYEVSSGVKPALKSLCDGYGFDKNSLFTLENKNDVLKHSVSTTWDFKEEVKLKKYSVSCKREVYSLPQKLIPYAFFEEVLLNGEIANFLTPRLKPRASELKEFLGDFEQVLPPPHFKNDDLVTLLYKDKVEYAKVTLQNGLIDNVTLE